MMIIIMIFLGVLDCVRFLYIYTPCYRSVYILTFVLYLTTLIDNNHNTVDYCRLLKLNYFVVVVNIYTVAVLMPG